MFYDEMRHQCAVLAADDPRLGMWLGVLVGNLVPNCSELA